MADYSRTVWDTAPYFWAMLTDSEGQAANLTDATLRFIMRAIRGPSPKVFAPAIIDNPLSEVDGHLINQVHYEPIIADVDTEGGYFIDWEVTYANGKVETFPNDGSMTCDIFADLGSVVVP